MPSNVKEKRPKDILINLLLYKKRNNGKKIIKTPRSVIYIYSCGFRDFFIFIFFFQRFQSEPCVKSNGNYL